MKRIKAFTLIEVIVSLAVIGILAVGILPVMSGGLMFLNQSKVITQNIFDVQKEMELAIESTKAHASGLTPKTLKLFDGHEVEVTYYEVSTEKNGKKYSTLVSETRPPEYKSLDITGVIAVANNNLNLKVVPSKTGNSVEARHDPITDHEYFKTSYQWFVSRKGFNIPYFEEATVKEEEVGTIYPAFPYDYEPLPLNFDTVRLNNLTTFAGKHIVFTAEPVSIYGKFGAEAISNTIYVTDSLLPEKLLVHLDASLIDDSNGSAQVRKAGTISHVKSWTNQVLTTKSANQGTENKQPIVKTNPPQVDYIGKYVDFGSNDRLDISNYSDLIDENLSLYMVVRGNAQGVINHSSTTIHVADSGSNPNNAIIVPIANGWKIAKKDYTTADNNPAGSLRVDSVDIDIAEILVYKQLDSTEDEAVINYLKNKYKMFVPNSKIVKLHDFNDDIFRGESYTLPSTVLATFADGKTSYVQVTWTNLADAPGGIVDTSKVRTLIFKGVATDDPSKEVVFRLVIKPVTQLTQLTITPITIPMTIGDKLTMMFSYEPMNATIQSYKWSSSNATIATIDPKTGELEAVANGITQITIQANGLTSMPFEIKVGEDAVPVTNYLREWNFDSGVEGWTSNYLDDFKAVSGILSGVPTRTQASTITRSSINLKVNNKSQVEIRMKNNSDATSLRIEFRNTNHSNFNQNRRRTFSITSNDTEFKTYSFDLSDMNQWGHNNNNLNVLRIYPTYNDRYESFEIDYIKITE